MILCKLCNNILPNGMTSSHRCSVESSKDYIILTGKVGEIADGYWTLRHHLETNKNHANTVKSDEEQQKLKIKVKRYRYLIDQLLSGVSIKKAKRNWKY